MGIFPSWKLFFKFIVLLFFFFFCLFVVIFWFLICCRLCCSYKSTLISFFLSFFLSTYLSIYLSISVCSYFSFFLSLYISIYLSIITSWTNTQSVFGSKQYSCINRTSFYFYPHPCNYFLLRNIKTRFRARRMGFIEDRSQVMMNQIKTVSVNNFQNCFLQWEQRFCRFSGLPIGRCKVDF